jgi:hypothetical protein
MLLASLIWCSFGTGLIGGFLMGRRIDLTLTDATPDGMVANLA